MPYAGRPGISPALATLIGLERVRKNDWILDVGSGKGTEALLLAKWGFRHVVGIEPDASSVATARRRASRWRLKGRVDFQRMGAEQLPKRFPAPTFDVVLHTLVANNLRKERDAHFRAIASVMKPNAILVCQERVTKKHENRPPDAVAPLAALRRHFELSPGISTQLPEFGVGASPDYARVVLWLGQPKPG